jgi:hypothetical protein
MNAFYKKKEIVYQAQKIFFIFHVKRFFNFVMEKLQIRIFYRA